MNTYRIVDVFRGEKNGDGFWIVSLAGDRLVRHFLWIPNPLMEQKKYERSTNQLQQFMDKFNLDYTRPFNPEVDWVGATGNESF